MVSFMFFHQMARWRLLEVFLCKATSCQIFGFLWKLKPEGHRVCGKVFSLINQQFKLFPTFNYHINVRHHNVLYLVDFGLDPMRQNIFLCQNQQHDSVLRCYLIRVPHWGRIRAFLAESLDFAAKNIDLELLNCYLAITGLNSVFMAKAIAEFTLSPNCLRNFSSTQVRNLKASPRSYPESG